jgi:beta propeller repeat protein
MKTASKKQLFAMVTSTFLPHDYDGSKKGMKKTNISKFTIALTVVILVLFSGLALNPADAAIIKFDEFQITNDPGVQEQPDINGVNIVWQDNRNGNWDIYMYTLEHTFTPETQITTNPANQMQPAISGDKIVYQDDRNGNWDIYMYNITAKTETQITNNTASQESPDIDGNIIVWQDNRNGNWDIYYYNLTSKIEKCLTSAAVLSPYTVLFSENPSISGNIIVYEKAIKETWYDFQTYEYVYCFNLSSGQELDISRASYKYDSVNEPAIYGNTVVWQYLGIIYSKDLSSSVSCEVTGGNRWSMNPDICQNYLVYASRNDSTRWDGNLLKNWDIYLTNLDTNTEYQVTNNNASQISGGRVVYMDFRNGNWDIYMTMISYAPETISPPPYEGRSPAQARPSQGSLNETKNLSFMSVEFEILFAIVAIIAIVVPITLIVYYKKHKQLVKNKKL